MMRLAILLFVSCMSIALAAPARAHVPDDTMDARVDLSADAVYLYDPAGDFDIETVRLLSRADFGPARGFGAMRGSDARNGAAWIRLDVPRQIAGGEWWLSVGPATVTTVTLYAPDASGRLTMRELGASTPFADRPVRFRLPVFPLRLEAAPDGRTLYLRVSGQSTTHEVEPAIWRPSAFVDMAEREYALWGAYFGILVLLLTFTLFFWLELRSAAYLRYSLYLGAFFAMVWLLEGFGAQWLLPGSPETAIYLTRAFALVAMGYTLWFSLKLLELERRFPLLHQIAAALSLMQAGGALAILFVSDGVVLRVALVVALAWQPVFFALLRYQWHRRPDLRPVIIAFAPQMLGLAIAVLRYIGVVPAGFWSSHALEATGIVHMVALSLALMRRVRDSERRALLLSRESEERLDRKVGERTSELAEANHRLMSEIAERRAAQAELASSLESERRILDAQRDFVAMVSHEFRTPLAVIKTVAQRLRSHAALQNADLQQRLGRVDRATTRMTAMMETYLADDRMRAPERARQTTRFNAAALVSAAVEHHGGSTDPRIRLDVPDAAPDIDGDLGLLTVALANLIDNGLKYSIAPAPVLIATTREAGMVRFRVTDEGAGVTGSERERIFQRYVRGSASSGRGGAGLGLHLAQEIARLHGGDIAIEQTNPAGSTFALTVPTAPVVRDVEPARNAATTDQQGGIGMGMRNIGVVWRRALLIAALACAGSGYASAADWVYRVRPGDNLWDLAAVHLKADVPWPRLQAYNRVPDPKHLPPGQRLRFPVEWLRVQPERARIVAVRGAVRIAVDGRAEARAGAADMRIATNGWVETGEDASATVEFADGSRLLLASRSRVVFDRLSSFGKTGMVDSEIRLQRGRAMHRVAPQNGPAARYEVSTPSATSSVRGTRFRVAYEDGRETTEVVEGHVGVDGGTGAAELRAGYGSRNDGGVRARALLPAPDLTTTAFDSLPILLEWPLVPAASGYQIDVVRADAPEVQLFEAVASSPNIGIGTLPAGHHLIRVRAVDAEGVAGLDANLPIEIPEGPAPPLTIRPANAEVSYLPKPRFEWSRSEGAEGARVQIARDAAMGELVHELDSASTHARPPVSLSAGTYWWRVAARDAQGRFGLFGSALPFEVRPMPSDAQLAAPSVKEGELVLRWRSVPEIPRYRVELSRHADLRDPVIDTTVETPELLMKKPRGGRWYVRVHALTEDGEAMELGSIQEIRLPCVLCYAGGAASVALLLLAL